MVAAVAVPAALAEALRDAHGNFAATVSLDLADTTDGWVRTTRTPQQFRGTELAPDALLLFHTVTVAPAGAAVALRVGLESDGREAGRIVAGQIDVRTFPPDSLTASDIVISPRDGAGSFTRGDVHLSLAPQRVYRPGESFTLYYELYGLQAGSSYDTELEIEPLAGGVFDRLRSVFGRQHALRFSFREQAGAPDPVFGVQQTRVVDGSALTPGAHRIRITVMDRATGRRVVVERVLEIATG